MTGWFYDAVTSIGERNVMAAIRSELLSSLRGEIVEVGAGTGLTFPHYGPDAHVQAIEPNASMLSRARKRAALSRARIEVTGGDAGVLDALPSESVDFVVATLVLCSVRNPLQTVRRIHRVLKPGGSLVTIEHVRAESRAARLQDWLTPCWRKIASNCHLNRVLEPTLNKGGFSKVQLESRALPMPLSRLLYGIATKERAS